MSRGQMALYVGGLLVAFVVSTAFQILDWRIAVSLWSMACLMAGVIFGYVCGLRSARNAGVQPARPPLSIDLLNLLRDFELWSRQVVERPDVPHGVRLAADKISKRATAELNAALGVPERVMSPSGKSNGGVHG